MADTPVKTAQEFLKTSFGEYSIEETIEHTTKKDETGAVKHRFVFLIRTDTDDEKRIRITTSGTESGTHEVTLTETVIETADQAESLAAVTVDSTAEAGRAYLRHVRSETPVLPDHSTDCVCVRPLTVVRRRALYLAHSESM